MEPLCGSWKLTSVDNFENYVDAIGITGDEKARALEELGSPDKNIVQVITINGEDIGIETTMPSVKQVIKATIGQQNDQKALNGADLKICQHETCHSTDCLWHVGSFRTPALLDKQIVVHPKMTHFDADFTSHLFPNKVVYTRQGDSLVEDQSGAFTSRNIRSVSGTEMTMTMEAGGVKCTRKYSKV